MFLFNAFHTPLFPCVSGDFRLLHSLPDHPVGGETVFHPGRGLIPLFPPFPLVPLVLGADFFKRIQLQVTVL